MRAQVKNGYLNQGDYLTAFCSGKSYNGRAVLARGAVSWVIFASRAVLARLWRAYRGISAWAILNARVPPLAPV